MTGQILVPLDGSELSHRAIPWADAWAGALGADVELIKVMSTPAIQAVSSDDVYDYFGERESIEAQRVLTAAASKFTQAPHVATFLTDGLAADAIVSRAHQSGAALIVMATHGRTGFIRTLMGSVAASVTRRSRIPVLAIRTDLTYPAGVPRRVLVPVDGSELSAGVLPYLIPIAKALRLGVCLYWVAPGGSGQAETAGRIQELAAGLDGEGIEATIDIEEAGDAAASIVSYASRQHFSFIAMSTHGVGGDGRWTLGSVTDWTIRHAHVPVMAVRPQQVPTHDWTTLQFNEAPVSDHLPGIRVAFSDRQAQVTRLALKNLAWSASRHDGITQQIRDALLALDSAVEEAGENEKAYSRTLA